MADQAPTPGAANPTPASDIVASRASVDSQNVDPAIEGNDRETTASLPNAVESVPATAPLEGDARDLADGLSNSVQNLQINETPDSDARASPPPITLTLDDIVITKKTTLKKEDLQKWMVERGLPYTEKMIRRELAKEVLDWQNDKAGRPAQLARLQAEKDEAAAAPTRKRAPKRKAPAEDADPAPPKNAKKAKVSPPTNEEPAEDADPAPPKKAKKLEAKVTPPTNEEVKPVPANRKQALTRKATKGATATPVPPTRKLPARTNRAEIYNHAMSGKVSSHVENPQTNVGDGATGAPSSLNKQGLNNGILPETDNAGPSETMGADGQDKEVVDDDAVQETSSGKSEEPEVPYRGSKTGYFSIPATYPPDDLPENRLQLWELMARERKWEQEELDRQQQEKEKRQ